LSKFFDLSALNALIFLMKLMKNKIVLEVTGKWIFSRLLQQFLIVLVKFSMSFTRKSE